MKLENLLKIKRVLGNHKDDKMPTILAYKIMKFLKAAEDESNFYDEKFKEIIDKYAEKDSNGQLVIDKENGISIQSGKAKECEECYLELNNTEVVVPEIFFSITELTPINFTVAELYILDEIIKEE